MSLLKPSNDGRTHLNIYSKAQTELGRFLSNFTKCSIVTEDGPFMSIEGYWYWLSCKHDVLRTTYGHSAKAIGRACGGQDWVDDDEFKRKICAAIEFKLMLPEAWRLCNENPDLLLLPFVHYYVYGKKTIQPKEGKWVIEKIKSFISERYVRPNSKETGKDPKTD